MNTHEKLLKGYIGIHTSNIQIYTYILFKQSSVLTIVRNVSLKPYKDVFITIFLIMSQNAENAT